MRVAMLALWVALLLPAPLRADEFDERIEVEPGGLLEVDLDLGVRLGGEVPPPSFD